MVLIVGIAWLFALGLLIWSQEPIDQEAPCRTDECSFPSHR